MIQTRPNGARLFLKGKSIGETLRWLILMKNELLSNIDECCIFK